jgi:transporter family protein
MELIIRGCFGGAARAAAMGRKRALGARRFAVCGTLLCSLLGVEWQHGRLSAPVLGSSSWLPWALLSAAFAALTAILAKVGVSEINSNFATFIRTLVIVIFVGLLMLATGSAQPISQVPRRALIFLVLSGLATGASWLCYFRALSLGQAAEVAPVEKISVVLVALFGVVFLSEQLTVRAWIGIFLISSGVVLIAYRST